MIVDTIDGVVRSALASHQLPLHYYVEFAHHALRCLRDLEMDIGLRAVRLFTATLDNEGNVTVPADTIDVSPAIFEGDFTFNRDTGVLSAPEMANQEMTFCLLVRNTRLTDAIDPYCVPTLEAFIRLEFALFRGSARNQYQIDIARQSYYREVKTLRARRTRNLVGFIRNKVAKGINQYSHSTPSISTLRLPIW